PDGTEAIADLQSLSRTYVNAAGQAVTSDAYFDLSGLTYSTSTTLGTAGTNFDRTQQAYDDRGRPNRTVSPTGTITRTVYDGLGRVVSAWVGTNDTPASGYWSPTNNTSPANMVEVSSDVYDNVNEAIETQQYDGDGVTITTSGGVPQALSASLLRAQTVTGYDDQGRAY